MRGEKTIPACSLKERLYCFWANIRKKTVMIKKIRDNEKDSFFNKIAFAIK